MRKKLRTILFSIIYVLLTVVKMFTGVVVGLGEPTYSLVAKTYPTIKNTWSMGEENAVNIARHQGTWYYEKDYWLLSANENGFSGDFSYYLLILVWWLVTLLIFIKVVRFLLSKYNIIV
ncbi:hypothetical protein [Desulfosporosinus sp. BICA1-9]|uniref:hypothetical protein n=1 Tax=Desulfosporosinus sp. BICA1-9 TaxID=1531958 RepID=UPI00054C680D|nr:hypothetical protein [Desulfosporosinus sp. BICA1-9]KJS48018.1 MAG: hypothetical protein VR66_16445 [Peptococcaceae bacterium BRH_c23]KJS82028.1 MAG: hypothetical protein JL57_25305 [Desulfosporosinus sp. BICA1-9]HBW35353.1 hypothetical protein [Desulfosporosinus sp.]